MTVLDLLLIMVALCSLLFALSAWLNSKGLKEELSLAYGHVAALQKEWYPLCRELRKLREESPKYREQIANLENTLQDNTDPVRALYDPLTYTH